MESFLTLLTTTSMLASRAPNRTVLVVIADPAVRELMAVNMRHSGIFPVLAATYDDGDRLAGEVLPDAVLLDLDAAPAGTPAQGKLTKLPQGIPLVMLTSRLEEACGLDRQICGASACIRKPINPRQLVGTLLQQMRTDNTSEARSGSESDTPRRRGSARPRSMRVGRLELDPEGHQAWLHGDGQSSAVPLAPREIRLLHCLMQHPDRVLSRAAILDQAWRGDDGVGLRTVDQYIKRLRRRLEEIGGAEIVQTVKGHGYRLHVDR